MRCFLTRLFLGACILASCPSLAWTATNLPFGQAQTGAITSAAQSNSYTFSANAGDVVDFTMLASSGNLVPKLVLYNPSSTQIASNFSGSPFGCSGNRVELNTVLLATTGAYTLLVSDCSSTNTGDYSIYAQRTNDPSGAANLPFGQVQTGAISSAAQSASYTFSANANDEVDFTLVATTGFLIPEILLYNPNGTLNSSNFAGSPFGCSGSRLELNTVVLPTTGTYTLLVRDCQDTNTGNFEINAQKTDSPAGLVDLLFAQPLTGAITSATQSNSYTFSATANDRMDFTLVATSGALVPEILVYNPSGTLNSSNFAGSPFGCSGSRLELNTVLLPTTGTYTVLVRDCQDTNTGSYAIYAQRTNRPTAAANLTFGGIENGLIGSVTQSSAYTFNATANDRVDFTLVATNGTLVPEILVYNPNGTLNSSNFAGSPFGCSGSRLELNTVPLLTTGTYTVLVRDCQDTNTGNFALYAQRTNNPAVAPALLWGGEPQSGSIASVAQSNSYAFQANAGAAILTLTMVGTTPNGTLVPEVLLYNPDGTLNSSNFAGNPFGCSGSSVSLSSISLSQSGIYTLLVRDCQDTKTGTYNLAGQCPGCATPSSQTITFGPLSNQPYGTPPFSVSATATSGLPLTFTITNEFPGRLIPRSVCQVSGNTVTLLAAGQCTIQASQPGNAAFLAATPIIQSFQVTRAPQTITFATQSNRSLGTSHALIPAAASSGLPLNFTSTTETVCRVSGTVRAGQQSIAYLTLVAVGQCTIQASQAGNPDYLAATPVTQSFQVTP